MHTRTRSITVAAILGLLSSACGGAPNPSSPRLASAPTPVDAAPTPAPQTPMPTAPPQPSPPAPPGSNTVQVQFETDPPGAPSPAFEAVVGDWYVGDADGQRGLWVDGTRWRQGTPSSSLADQAKRLYGDRYAEFLDNVKAFAFFPLAVYTGELPPGDRKLSVRFYPEAGRIDQAAGLVWNIAADGSYWGVRANPLEDNILFFRYQRGKRTILQTVRGVSTPTKQWHTLTVTLRGGEAVVELDGQEHLRRAFAEPIAGRVGLWSKADSKVLFRDFTVEPLSANVVGDAAHTLEPRGYVDLPAHLGADGFDHADVHPGRGHVYLAHTANDALDIIEIETDKYIESISGLKGVAGALVAADLDLVFTSNRGEDTVGILSLGAAKPLQKIAVGTRPNGLAFDPESKLLLVGHGGDEPTVMLVDVIGGKVRSTLKVPGKTRWAVFDPQQKLFFVNIATPAQIVAIALDAPDRLARAMDVPAVGPHGLALDPNTGSLLCACDDKQLVRVDAKTGEVSGTLGLSGAPDVVFLNVARRHLYVASGDPGALDVVDVDAMKLLESIRTEKDANTLAFDATRNKIYAFLPQTHRAAVFVDG